MRRSLARHLATTALTLSLSVLAHSAWAAADLVPVTGNLAGTGQLGVINLGDSASGPTQMTLTCQKLGGGSCPEAPGMAAYENPAFPNAATIEVPELAPDQSFKHQLDFWNDLVWGPGSYQLSVMVDAGTAVAESNEANNATAVKKTQPFSSVGTPQPKGPGNLAPAGAEGPGKGPVAGRNLVAGLPDIIPTTLGFIMKNQIVPWGQTVTIDNPALSKAIRQGPQRNLCHFWPAAYRTHNKGPVAAGSFVTKVYRGSSIMHTHNVPGGLPAQSGINWHKFSVQLHEGLNVIRVVFDANKQVAESDEKNTYAIRVKVLIDCDGDGQAGSIGGIKAPVKKLRNAPAGRPKALDRSKIEMVPQRRAPKR